MARVIEPKLPILVEFSESERARTRHACSSDILAVHVCPVIEKHLTNIKIYNLQTSSLNKHLLTLCITDSPLCRGLNKEETPAHMLLECDSVTPWNTGDPQGRLHQYQRAAGVPGGHWVAGLVNSTHSRKKGLEA